MAAIRRTAIRAHEMTRTNGDGAPDSAMALALWGTFLTCPFHLRHVKNVPHKKRKAIATRSTRPRSPFRILVSREKSLLRRERVLLALAGGDFRHRRLALHRAGDGQLGGVVVVLVDLRVVLGFPVDEHAADD